MKKGFFIPALCLGAVLTSCGSSTTSSSVASTETAPETKTEEVWTQMFDGSTFTGWRGYNRKDMPKAWTIEDKAIKINGGGQGEAGGKDGGDIIFDQQFKNFEFQFEWKVSPKGNSGVFYLGQEVEGEPIWKSSPEYQILDNIGHPDAILGKDGNRQSASLYDLIPAKPQNAKAVGEWNTATILVFNGTVIHKQNGETVVEYHLWTQDWKKMVLGSKFKDYEMFLNAGGETKKGYIGLQDHGDDVWFRNLKIREL